jgi:hypothetical protein
MVDRPSRGQTVVEAEEVRVGGEGIKMYGGRRRGKKKKKPHALPCAWSWWWGGGERRREGWGGGYIWGMETEEVLSGDDDLDRKVEVRMMVMIMWW